MQGVRRPMLISALRPAARYYSRVAIATGSYRIRAYPNAAQRRLLACKSDWYGKILVEVDRWYPSSKTCSQRKREAGIEVEPVWNGRGSASSAVKYLSPCFAMVRLR